MSTMPSRAARKRTSPEVSVGPRPEMAASDRAPALKDYSLKSSGTIVMKMVTSTIARALHGPR
jgi:hypothetical protein